MSVLAHLGVVGGVATVVLLALRTVLIVVISVWSLKTDEKGRRHALALLSLLQQGRVSVKARHLSNGAVRRVGRDEG